MRKELSDQRPKYLAAYIWASRCGEFINPWLHKLTLRSISESGQVSTDDFRTHSFRP